jgi:hypothetical protein
MRLPILAVLLIGPLSAYAQQPSLTAAEVMSRVAANRDRSEIERTHFVYVQHAHTLSRKGKTIRCEETTDFRITPTEKGSAQQLLTLDGRLLRKGKYIHYTQLGGAKDPDKTDTGKDSDDLHVRVDSDDDAMDRDLVENMRQNLTASRSRDGIGAGLFPLTSKVQADYVYTLAGRGPMNGRDCFHITFLPRDKDDYGWKGDAWIDATHFQPVVVRTTMARNLPFAVRTLMGTSVPGLGFTVTYAPQPSDAPDDLWFPVSFGTEFKLHLLFFLNRSIVIDAKNSDFEKTHVKSTILPGPSEPSLQQ